MCRECTCLNVPPGRGDIGPGERMVSRFQPYPGRVYKFKLSMNRTFFLIYTI